VARAGLSTAQFYVVESPQDITSVALPYPLFAKPVAEGTGKGVSAASVIRTEEELRSVCVELLNRFQQPVLVETFLPGREFTVGILGTGENARVLGTLEVQLLSNAEQDAYSYVNKERYKELVQYTLVHPQSDSEVAESEALALTAWRELKGRDGGRIDVRSDGQGRPAFIEVNPLAGLHPEHSDLPMIATKVGLGYQNLIRQILDSATERVQIRQPANPG
jgi:D-alanine-D-alanine ligase